MTAPHTPRARMVAALALLTLCACRDASRDATSSGDQPVRGGTLHLVGNLDADSFFPTAAALIFDYQLFRGTTRQLLTFPSDSAFERQLTLVADIAREVPTRENGGISNDGLTYTFHLQPNVRWNSAPPRAVTAGDFVRAIKMTCNPALPGGTLPYYTATISGLTAYCDGFAKVKPTPPAMRAYLESHDVSGVRAVDDSTLRITLRQPALDFLNLVALPALTPFPIEYLAYLPNDAQMRQHLLSVGPYAVHGHIANRTIALGRNPTWDASTDHVRRAWVDSIHVDVSASAEAAWQQIEAGTADAAFGIGISPTTTTQLVATHDPRLVQYPAGEGAIWYWYLAINMNRTAAGGALTKLEVRHALQYAVNRMAIVQISSGPSVTMPTSQVALPGWSGHTHDEPYATSGWRGDSARARQLLAAAGYPNGLTLKLAAMRVPQFEKMAQTLQADFNRAGITLEIITLSPVEYFGTYLGGLAAAERGDWDLAIANWSADWFGVNGRSVYTSFDDRAYMKNTGNYGHYANAEANRRMDRALAARTTAEADSLWRDYTALVNADSPIIPLVGIKGGIMHAPRVRNCLVSVQGALGADCDITNLWLAGAKGGQP